MILTTHAIVGGALASLFPTHPIVAVAAGFASHFAIDAIPHWDYPLQSISVARGHRNHLKWQDAALIALDACLGLALAVGLFSAHAPVVVIMLGAIAGMLPDPLQLFTVSTLMSRWSRCRGSIGGFTRNANLSGRLALVRRLFSRR
jgi:hypothetical protein